jgi:hypothetical protein
MIHSVKGAGIIQSGAANNPIEFEFPGNNHEETKNTKEEEKKSSCSSFLRGCLSFFPRGASRQETCSRGGTPNALRHEGSSVIYFACRAPRTPGMAGAPTPTRSSDIRGLHRNHISS